MKLRTTLTIASMTTLLTLTASMAFASPAPGAAEIFKGKCASCHGADGTGNTPVGKAMKVRDLSAADVQKQNDADLMKVISDGKGKMPAYKAKLSQADITTVVAYIRGMAKK